MMRTNIALTTTTTTQRPSRGRKWKGKANLGIGFGASRGHPAWSVLQRDLGGTFGICRSFLGGYGLSNFSLFPPRRVLPFVSLPAQLSPHNPNSLAANGCFLLPSNNLHCKEREEALCVCLAAVIDFGGDSREQQQLRPLERR